jgi:hypothetical protein
MIEAPSIDKVDSPDQQAQSCTVLLNPTPHLRWLLLKDHAPDANGRDGNQACMPHPSRELSMPCFQSKEHATNMTPPNLAYSYVAVKTSPNRKTKLRDLKLL